MATNPHVKVLVTGSSGQLGTEIQAMATDYPSICFLFTDREALSVTNEDSINDFFIKNKPDYCINCAAYTAVDKAEEESERGKAEWVNAVAPGYIAKACRANHIRLIHISTDYVFDGKKNTPYFPEDIANPLSVYGKTKLMGEQNALRFTDAIVIRTSWVYSSYGNNFVKTMIRLMREREALNVVADQYGTPTYAGDLAKAILQIIISKKWEPGIYHYSNEGIANWYEFALAIKNAIITECVLSPITTAQYPTAAKRPAYTVLNKDKIKAIYNIDIPQWGESLRKCLQLLKH